MADSYERDEPHYRPGEPGQGPANLLRVAEQDGHAPAARHRLRRRLRDRPRSRDTFDEIHGLDADPGDAGPGRHEQRQHHAARGCRRGAPVRGRHFDLVTAYSVLHHLADHRPVLAEAARVLRPGGVLYVDLEPNRAFWQAIDDVETSTRDDGSSELDEIVAREVRAVLHIEDDVHDRFAIEPEIFRSAEYIKSHLGGFEPGRVRGRRTRRRLLLLRDDIRVVPRPGRR